MFTINTHTVELSGSSYEIGYELGKVIGKIPSLKAYYIGGMEGFGTKQVTEAIGLFDRWCPGLTDELCGFADALSVKPEQIVFYVMTYLLPRCSQIALLPNCTEDGKPLLARSYEFNHEAEDFCLIRTKINGKYTHMGTSVLHFGREDGFNEHGLAVTMSSCGFPVGAMPYMRAPKQKGLQFWAVIRALLENCKDVAEALAYLEGMPIASNLNLMLMDKHGSAALFETMDGQIAVKRLDFGSSESMLFAANHIVLPELTFAEPKAMVHSIKRYAYIQEQLLGKTGIGRTKLKEMLLDKYPDGLCCHYYEDYFGTTKSMIISPVDKTIELCWGGRSENGWHTYDIREEMKELVREIQIDMEIGDPKIYDWQPIQ